MCMVITVSCLHSLSITCSTPGGDNDKIKGCWDSIHVVEVLEKGRTAHYKLTSTVMLWLQTIKAASGTMNLGGSLTRQVPTLNNAHLLDNGC